MQYSKLQKTNIKISRLGLGTNAVGGHNLYDNLNEENGKEFVDDEDLRRINEILA